MVQNYHGRWSVPQFGYGNHVHDKLFLVKQPARYRLKKWKRRVQAIRFPQTLPMFVPNCMVDQILSASLVVLTCPSMPKLRIMLHMDRVWTHMGIEPGIKGDDRLRKFQAAFLRGRLVNCHILPLGNQLSALLRIYKDKNKFTHRAVMAWGAKDFAPDVFVTNNTDVERVAYEVYVACKRISEERMKETRIPRTLVNLHPELNSYFASKRHGPRAHPQHPRVQPNRRPFLPY